jgi:mRNA interferase MazF
MEIYSRHDVVRVPFPFTDRSAQKNRPALVLSDATSFNNLSGHSLMAMITSAGHAPWPFDVPITDLRSAGLPIASLVRFKLFTLDHRLIRGTLGRLGNRDSAHVTRAVRRLLG